MSDLELVELKQRVLRLEAMYLYSQAHSRALAEALSLTGLATVQGAPLQTFLTARTQTEAHDLLRRMADYYPNDIAPIEQFLRELTGPPTA